MTDRKTEVIVDALNVLASANISIKASDAGKLNQLINEFADLARGLQEGRLAIVPVAKTPEVEGS